MATPARHEHTRKVGVRTHTGWRFTVVGCGSSREARKAEYTDCIVTHTKESCGDGERPSRAEKIVRWFQCGPGVGGKAVRVEETKSNRRGNTWSPARDARPLTSPSKCRVRRKARPPSPSSTRFSLRLSFKTLTSTASPNTTEQGQP